MLYTLKVALKATCQTLSKAFLKSTKTWYNYVLLMLEVPLRQYPAVEAQAWGEAVINALDMICNKTWQTGDWPTPWTQSLVITLPKKGNIQYNARATAQSA